MGSESAAQVAAPLRDALREFLTAMADDELLLGHRDSEWTGHAPILEEDIAFSNLAQDEMGHALTWYTLAAARELGGPDPDRAAFFRNAGEFRNATLVELPKGDWAFTIVRRYLFDTSEQVRYAALAESAYRPVADAVAKLRREETYHLLHSRGWVQRLGDATEESHRRMQAALDVAWPHALGLFEPIEGESTLVSADVKPPEDALREQWLTQVKPVLEAATLAIPSAAPMAGGGRSGQHTQHLADLLNEMQKVARMEPEATW
ncbi:MAG: 1,2-phenylacetyl-CoA epoxidase subunit PaaC [Anaerolineae bacterium]